MRETCKPWAEISQGDPGIRIPPACAVCWWFAVDFCGLAVLQVSARQVNQAALARAVAVLGSLCADVGIRAQLAQSRECWQASLELLVREPGLDSQPSLPFLCSPHSPEPSGSVWDLG